MPDQSFGRLRLLYWGVTGALFGFGIIAIFSVGWPILFLALGLLVIGLHWLGSYRVWAIPFGFGLVPALVLVNLLLTLSPHCPSSVMLSGHGFETCGSLQSYSGTALLAAVFGDVTLGGVLFGAVAESGRLHAPRWACAFLQRATPRVHPPAGRAGTPLPVRALMLLAAVALWGALIVATNLAHAAVGWPVMFLGFPLVVSMLGLLFGAAGLRDALLAFVALEVVMALLVLAMQLAIPPAPCAPARYASGECGFSALALLRFAASTGAVMLSGAVGGVAGLLVRRALSRRARGERGATPAVTPAP